MAEMRTINCPECEAANQPLAVIEGIQEFRCRSCGLLYYGPCGCDTVHEIAEESLLVGTQARADGSHGGNEHGGNGRLPAGFEMLLPVVSVEHASYVQKYPGCS